MKAIKAYRGQQETQPNVYSSTKNLKSNIKVPLSQLQAAGAPINIVEVAKLLSKQQTPPKKFIEINLIARGK